MQKNFLKKFPIFFIFIVWFIFSSPYFLKGLVPYPSTYHVNHFPPWSHYEKFWGPVKNGAMPDIISQMYPWRHLTVELLKQGQIPLWNPYNFSGNPHLANYQSAVLSPFNLLFFILPFIDAWSILILLQPLLAGIFMYLLLREFRVSKIGSIIGSICFMFSGFLVVWMAYGTLSLAISLLPLALFSVERFYNSTKIRYLILLSLTFPLSFFSGHFQTSLYFLFFVLLYITYKFVSTKKIHDTLYIILYTFFGLFLTMPQIIPSIELYLNSVRSEIFNEGGGVPFYYLVTIFAPDFFGNPVTRNDWLGQYAERASFIGIIPLTLAIFGLIKRKSSISLFFFLAGLVVLLLALDSPIQNLLGALKIPVLSTSNPTRIIVLFSFSFAVLAGFGLDALKEFIVQKKIKKIFFVSGGILLLFAIIWSLLLVFKILPSDKILIAQRNLILPTLLFLGAFAILVMNLFIKKKNFMLLSLIFLLLGASFDSLRFAQKWMPFDPKNLVFRPLPVISEMQKSIEHRRYFGNLGTEVASYYNLASIEGYDPLYIGRYGEFVNSAVGEIRNAERSVVKLSRTSQQTDRVLDLLAVNIIFHPIADTNQGWAYPVWNRTNRINEVYKDDKFQLFKNTQALRRADLFYEYEVIKEDTEILKRLYDSNFDFRKKLILEEQIGLTLKSGSPRSSRAEAGWGDVEIIKMLPNFVEIDVKTSEPAILFLSDNYYAGWRASIDGKPTKIYRANYTFRAVVVPKGASRVKFEYNPVSFKSGVYLAFGGFLGIIVFSYFRSQIANLKFTSKIAKLFKV